MRDIHLDPKPQRRYDQTLKSSPKEMVHPLEGRAAARKCTHEVSAIAQMHRPDLLAEPTYGASSRRPSDPLKGVWRYNSPQRTRVPYSGPPELSWPRP